MGIDWIHQLHDQLDRYWQRQLRPRLSGLADEEYFWEPVPGCWNVRRRGESTAPMAIGAGEFTVDVAIPDPDPAPVTTIAWRLAHIIVGVLGDRTANHFGGAPAESWEDAPMTQLVLHINREKIHHGAEVCLLRDLYLHRAVG
jgi:hypothetical protein